MKILAVDTATHSCGVAVANDAGATVQIVRISRRTHSRQLLSLIDLALREAELTVADLDGLAVTQGPGSFTGLRIGLSTIKGLAYAVNRPVVGISSLEALAWGVYPAAGLICTLLDARKNEVYAACYRFAQGSLKTELAEAVLPPRQLLSLIEEPCFFVGTGTTAYQAEIKTALGDRARLGLDHQHLIRPEIVAFLGQQRLAQETTDDPETLEPVYLRQPDAVLNASRPAGPV